MGIKYEDLEELCETVGHKIQEANDKIRMSNGDLTGGDIDYVDKLAHTLKSIKTIMAMIDAEDDGYSRENGSNMGGTSGRYYNRSYARGRGSYAKRDSMGRYSRSRYGYSGADNEDMIEQLRELMNEAPDDKTRQEFQKFISKVESM